MLVREADAAVDPDAPAIDAPVPRRLVDPVQFGRVDSLTVAMEHAADAAHRRTPPIAHSGTNASLPRESH